MIRNCLTVFQNDPVLQGAVRYNILTERIDIVKPLWWSKQTATLTDTDLNYLMLYLPELMSMFKEVADIKTSDQLHLPVPDAKFETVVVKPSETQKAMVQELSRRAAEIHSGNVDASVDNMLCVTNDGRKIGLDVRLMNPMLPDDPNSKLNVCVRNVLKIWEEGKDQKLTQLLFCDLSTPKNDGNFNVYDDIRKKLIAAGVPENEIEFIDNILLNEKPADFEAFLQKLEQQGYEIKRGKHTSVKGARQKRFIRFRTLGAGYSEDEIKAVIAGEAEHRPHQKQPPKEKPFHLLVDIQAKLSEGKSESYARWAKRYNLKEMSKTLIFLQENKIGNIEEMQERVDAATAHYHELGDSIKAAEQRMAEIAVLRAHIINYAKTRPVYDAYRKAGYSKKFLEEHREQITLHRAAKATFDEAGLKKLPKVKELNTEYSTLLSQKKAAYPAYRKARDEMQELMKAQKNVEIFFAEEKTTKEKAQTR